MFCTDRDLMILEPRLYLTASPPAQTPLRGQMSLAGTTLSCPTADFAAAGVKAGMAVCLYAETPAEGAAFEIAAVQSPTQLAVSVVRADATGPLVAPPPAAGMPGVVVTYAAQIASVSATLAEKLRQISEAAGIAAASFADSGQLRAAGAAGALWAVFVARASAGEDADSNWLKARHYHQLFLDLQSQLRLAVDIDGDGVAESTRSLGNIMLRRV
jgi:hypothetical protein